MRTSIYILAILLVASLASEAQVTQRSFVVGSGAVNATGGGYKMRGTVGQPVIGIVGTTTKAKQGFWYTVGAGGGLSQVQINVSVFLQGPYSGSAMGTALKAGGYLPTGQPFNVAPWSYGGSEVSTLPTNMVDWVLIELRTGNPATPPMTVAGRIAGIVLSDGSVKAGNGDPLLVTGIAPGSYYVVVHHRNHVSVMSSSLIDCSGGSCTWNFTDAVTKAYGTAAQKSLGSGKYGMFAADGNADRQVTAPDFNLYLAQTTAGATGYKSGDYNMDGQVTAPDFNLYLANTTAGAKGGVPLP